MTCRKADDDVDEWFILPPIMITKPILSLGIALLLPTMLWAGQESLAGLVKQEQANSDNEAVSVYGGKVGPAGAIFFIEWSGTGNPVEGRYYLRRLQDAKE